MKFWREADAAQSSRLQKLPSFISLLSSASPGDEGCKVERDEDEPGDEPGRMLSDWFCSALPQFTAGGEQEGFSLLLSSVPYCWTHRRLWSLDLRGKTQF